MFGQTEKYGIHKIITDETMAEAGYGWHLRVYIERMVELLADRIVVEAWRRVCARPTHWQCPYCGGYRLATETECEGCGYVVGQEHLGESNASWLIQAAQMMQLEDGLCHV